MQIHRSRAGGGSSPEVLRNILMVVLLFLLWRGMLFAFDFAGGAMTTERINNSNKDYQAFTQHWFWDGWARWDSGWYKRIVEKGYFIEGSQSNVVFFPLYPYLTRAVSKLTGNHWAAGLLISNVSLLLALFFVLGIARMYLDQEGARRSLVYLLVFPASFFFSAYYTEALFLLTTSASFYYYLKERYFWSGAWGLLATMTRSTGVALFLAYALGYLWNKRFRPSQMRPAALWLLLIPCGVLVFMAILKLQVGDPMAFVKYQHGWGRAFVFPLKTLVTEFQRVDLSFPRGGWYNIDKFIGLLTTLAFLASPFLLLGKFDIALPLYSLLLVLIPLSTGTLDSIMRYELVAFPAFFSLARLGANPNVDRFIIFTFALFLGLYNLQFFNWHWGG